MAQVSPEIVYSAISGLSVAVVTLWRQSRIDRADIVRLERAEATCQERLRGFAERLEQTEQVTAGLHRAVIVTAQFPDARIIDVTDDVQAMLGYHAAELVGKNIDVLIPEEFRADHQAAVERAIQSGVIRPGQLAVTAFALHSGGQRIPVVVTLSEKSRDPWIVQAQLNYRRT